MFTEANPDKGTKTQLDHFKLIYLQQQGLQKLTPIRGRKQVWVTATLNGGEGLQKLTPIRGRKHDVI